MKNPHLGRTRACLCTLLACLALPLPGTTAELLRFDFDGAAGFTATASVAAPGLTASWRDDAGLLGDLAGVSGRSLSASGFTAGNTVHLDIEIAPGLKLVAERLSFALRASASGPTTWQLGAAGTALASGTLATQFRRFDVDLTPLVAGGTLRLDFSGLGATASTGTLRLDEVVLDGHLSAVPLPPPIAGLAVALVLLGRSRRSRAHGAS